MSNFPTLVISATQTIAASRPLINTYITSSKTAIDNHVSGSADKHDAAFITYSSSLTSATTVESAIDTTYVRMNDHVAGTAEKHLASDITYSGSITSATTVESAIDTVNQRVSAHVTGTAEKHASGDILFLASAADTMYTTFNDHVSGVSNKHDSSIIIYSSTITTTFTVESAIDTLYGLVQAINSSGSTVEVVEARTAMNGEVYAALKNHLWAIEDMAGQIVTKTADATLLTTERGFIDVTNASANLTITLPSSVTTEIAYTIKKSFTSTFTVTIIATGSQTIDGTTAGRTLSNQYEMITVLSDGSNWKDFGGLSRFTNDIVTAAASGKILRMDGSGFLPTSITGDSATVGGFTPAQLTDTWVKIASQTLTAAATSITFSSIASGYHTYKLILNAGHTSSSTSYNLNVTFNGDVSSNYTSGTGIGAQNNIALLSILPANTTQFNIALIEITNYDSVAKPIVGRSFVMSGVSAGATLNFGGIWNKTTTSINTITLTASTAQLANNSRFVLWGANQ